MDNKQQKQNLKDMQDISSAVAEQNILHVSKWNHKIVRLLWILFGILVGIEIIITAVHYAIDAPNTDVSSSNYILVSFLLPCAMMLGTILIARILIRRYANRFSPLVQARFLLCTTIAVVTQVVCLHYGITVIYTLYVVPIVVSVIYVDSKTLRMTYILSIFCYVAAFYAYILPSMPPELYQHTYMALLGTICILTVVYVASQMMLSRIRELINLAVQQSIRETQLSHAVKLDSLTQLYNHATFYEMLDEHILRYQATGKAFSILIMDIDNFKAVNDTYGHDVGNLVILRLTEIIRECLNEGDLAFRYGGEEFSIITSDAENTLELAQTIRVRFSEATYEEIEGQITISIGVCTYNDSFGGRREFFSAADKALYLAKHNGKNRVEVMY